MWPFTKKKTKETSPNRRRFYAAAQMNRLTKSWSIANPTPADVLKVSLKNLRGRSRDLARNSDYARRFLKMAKTNIVGPNGVAMQSRVKDDNGTLDIVANQRIEDGWKEFCQKGGCTVDGGMTMIDACKLFVESELRDGEILVRKIKGWADNKCGFAMQFLEADFLDENLNAELRNGNQIRLGIEYNKWDRPVAYHLLAKHPGSGVNLINGKAYHRIPADEIIHGFDAERVNQGRGIPAMATSMSRINMLGGYEEAELVSARTASAKMGFFTTPDGDGYRGDEEDDDGDILDPIMEAEPGTFETLPTGVSFQEYNPQHPTSAFKDFIKSVLRGVASGLNISYVGLANDLEGVSYSSIRKGEMDDRDSWRVEQRHLIDHFLNEVFMAWLEMALTTQSVKLPLAKYEKFNAPVWRPRGWGWIDPVKEVAANIRAVTNGFKSMQDVASEQGRDVEEILEQIKREKELAKSLGLTLPAFMEIVQNAPQPAKN